MRIVAGSLKGRLLQAPPLSQVRPTADRVRQSIFNILESHRVSYKGACVLDVFAGSGALGLEALSRGAHKAVFVDRNALSVQTILKNSLTLGLQEKVLVLKREPQQLPLSSTFFSLVFLDPPYGKDLLRPAVSHLVQKGWIQEGTSLVLEMGAKESFDSFPGGDIWQDRTYGAARVVFATFKGGDFF